jgi:hypothetical protein
MIAKQRARNNIDHISMVSPNRNFRVLLVGFMGHQHPNSSTMDIARQERDPQPLSNCDLLELLDEPITFFLYHSLMNN